MKSKFNRLIESVLSDVTPPSPTGRVLLLKFLKKLVEEYQSLDKAEAGSLLKQYDEDPKSIGKRMTEIFDEMGYNHFMINDCDEFEPDEDTISWNSATKYAKLLDNLANYTGVDMKSLGLTTFMDYVDQCITQQEEEFGE